MCLVKILSGPEFVPADNAAIWLPPSGSKVGTTLFPSFNTIEAIAIPLLSMPLEQFFFGTLPSIVHKNHAEVPWHFNPLCRGCTFENDCRERALKEGTLGTMPDISLSDIAVLHELKDHARDLDEHAQTKALTDIEELDKICRNETLLAKVASSFPISTRRARRILRFSEKTGSMKIFGSPKVTAAFNQRPQVNSVPIEIIFSL